MKKLGLFVLAAGIAAAAGLIFLKSSTVAKVSPESLLPDNTYLTVEISNLKNNIEEFRKNRLGTAVSAIDFPTVMKELEIPQHGIDSFQSTVETVTTFLDSKMFSSLFGKKILAAFLPFTKEETASIAEMDGPKLKQLLFSKIVVILEPEHNIKFIEALRSLSTHFTGIKAEVIETYNNHAIQKVVLSDTLESYNTTIGDYLVVTLDRNTIINRINLTSATDGSLEDNAIYRKISAEFDPDTSLSIFANIEEMILSLNDAATRNGQNQLNKELNNVFDHLSGMQAMGIASYKDAEGDSRSKSILYFDRNKADVTNAKLLGTAPEKSRPLKLAPERTMFYYWTNTIDLKSIIERALPYEDELSSFSEALEMRTGVNLEQAIAGIGNEFSIILTDINTGGMFPILNIALLLEVNEKAIFEKMINSLLSAAEATGKMPMQLEQEELNGTTLNRIPLPYGTDLSPTYAYFDRYFIAGINTDLVKEMIAGFTNDTNLTKSPVFASADKGLTEKNNVIAFVDSTKFFDTLKDVVVWGNGFAAFTQPDLVENAGIISDQIVYPTLEGLKMFEAYSARSYILENKAIGESYTKINNRL